MDTTQRTDGKEIEGVTCRVAYMIDNEQPVLCTLIGNQPLFYADEISLESAMEEELFMEESSDDLLFRLTAESLRDKAIKLKEKRQAFVDANKSNIDGAFEANFKSLSSPTLLDINTLVNAIEKSRLGFDLLMFARAEKVDIRVSKEVDSVLYDRANSCILIPASMSKGAALVGLSQELRRVWQHKNGTLINPLCFQPEDAITINRAQIADLCVNKVRIAWELSLEGEQDAWSVIASSGLNDIAFTFEREVRHDFRNLNNGWGMQIAFEKWYLSDRCKLEDKKLIQTMLADHSGLVFESGNSSQMIGLDVVTRIGAMPFGKNYLSGFATSIIADPLYTEVRDRSSANFLWFVKFEAAFKDKERDLKEGQNSDTNKSSVRTTLFGQLEEEARYEEEGLGEIVAFPAVYENTGEKRKSRFKKTSGSATIVELFSDGKEQH